MKRSPDVDLVLRDYFADDGLTAPDHVLDVVENRISRQTQRRSWRLPWRNPMSTPFKLAAGLAAVVLVAVVGWQLLPGTTDPGTPTTAPTPSVQPTSAATAVATAAARFPAWYPPAAVADANGAGILTPGSHATRAFRPGFTFSAPDGWVNAYDEPNYFTLFPDTPANQAEFERAEGFAQSIGMGPHTSPYFFCDSLEDNGGATAAEMAAAVAANEAIATTGLIDVTIGGLTGKQFDVRFTGTCPPSPDDPPGLNLAEDRIRGILLDVPNRGVIVMFVGSITSADYEAFLAEAMPIVESFEFDLDQ